MKTYEIRTLADLAVEFPDRVRRRTVADAERVTMPPVQLDEASLRALFTSTESLSKRSRTETAYLAPALYCWELEDVLVHGRTGVVTIDGFAVEESVVSNYTGFTRDGAQITIAPPSTRSSLPAALHLLGEGAYNYHHFWFDCGGRAMLARAADRELPALVTTELLFQSAILDLFGVGHNRRHNDRHTLAVQRLVYPGDLHLIERYAPHPFLRAIATDLTVDVMQRDLNRLTLARSGGADRRVYIDRRNARRRRLLNEDALVDALGFYGFKPYVLETMTVPEQIELFATASHIVTPHGSGLINAMFAPRGVFALELFPTTYINWPNRHITHLAPNARYAAVVSDDARRVVENDGQTSEWSVDIDRVLAMLPADCTLRATRAGRGPTPNLRPVPAPELPEHYHREIPGWFNYADLYAEMIAAAPRGAKLVEVGSWMGASMAFLAVEAQRQGREDLELYAVDLWGTFVDGPGWDHQPAHRAYAQKYGGNLRACFEASMRRGELLVSQGGPVHVIEGDSAKSAELFDDASVFFVFIDAAHDTPAVLRDLRAWQPKIAPGGHLTGHDLPHPPVRAAVEEVLGPEGGRWRAHPPSCWRAVPR